MIGEQRRRIAYARSTHCPEWDDQQIVCRFATGTRTCRCLVAVRHQVDVAKPFVCHGCGAGFDSEGEYTQHWRDEHPGNRVRASEKVRYKSGRLEPLMKEGSS